MNKYEVTTSYTFNGSFDLDKAAQSAIGRKSDFSGVAFGDADNPSERDLGWICTSEFEAKRLKSALQKIGLTAAIGPHITGD